MRRILFVLLPLVAFCGAGVIAAASEDGSTESELYLSANHSIFESAVPQLFPKYPPIPQCSDSLIDVLCHSIQLDPASLLPFIDALKGIDPTDTVSSKQHQKHRSLSLLREEAKQTPEQKLSSWRSHNRNAKWDPSYLISHYHHITENLKEIRAFVPAVFAANSVDVRSRVEEAIQQARDEGGLAGCKFEVDESNHTSVSGCSSDLANYQLIQNSVLDHPLMAKPTLNLSLIPEVMLGFASSRIMAKVMSTLFGSIQVVPADPLGKGFGFYLPSGQMSIGFGACRASDYSLEYEMDPKWYTCAVVDLFTYLFCCGTDGVPVTCPEEPLSPVTDNICYSSSGDQDPTDESFSLDVRLQPTFTNDSTSANVEGPLYYWLYRSNMIAEQYTSLAACGATAPYTTHLVPGWTLIQEVRVSEEGDRYFVANDATHYPLSLLSQRFTDSGSTATCDFMLTLRGTSSTFEWLIDFSYRSTPSADGEFFTDEGFTRMASSFLPTVDSYFDSIFQNGTCDPSQSYIMVTGHSLGGALAELAALHLGTRYKPLGTLVELVSFAPAHALDIGATAALASVANVRSIIYEWDAIPSMPCAQESGLPRCDVTLNLVSPGDGRDNYYGHLNNITITTASLGAINASFVSPDWASIRTGVPFELSMQTPGSIEVAANHVCSYACWASSQYCDANQDGSARWMCSDCPMFTDADVAVW